MKRSEFSAEQIVGIVERPSHGGVLPAARYEHQHVYRWRAKYGGIIVSDARRLREMEEEIPKLKRLVADYALDNLGL